MHEKTITNNICKADAIILLLNYCCNSLILHESYFSESCLEIDLVRVGKNGSEKSVCGWGTDFEVVSICYRIRDYNLLNYIP